MDTTTVNHSRLPEGGGGFYESFFTRANHPTRPLAFWIRYTLLRPAGRPGDAVGELWAVLFDGESGEHVVRKREVPLSEASFSRSEFAVAVGDARLGPGALSGAAADDLSWDLTFTGDGQPLLLLPERLYGGGLPRAKSLVSLPLATFRGRIDAGGRSVDVDGWLGSSNHNWGTRHTDVYAWGQVAGFDDHPDTFLEVSTARLKIGPFWTPFLTPMVLRHDGDEHPLNGIVRSVGARGRFSASGQADGFEWEFRSGDPLVDVEGRIWAPRDAFVGLRYANPPGGEKHCLNTKIASCDLRVGDRRTGAIHQLTAAHRAAFEILTDDTAHGIAISA